MMVILLDSAGAVVSFIGTTRDTFQGKKVCFSIRFLQCPDDDYIDNVLMMMIILTNDWRIPGEVW